MLAELRNAQLICVVFVSTAFLAVAAEDKVQMDEHEHCAPAPPSSSENCTSANARSAGRENGKKLPVPQLEIISPKEGEIINDFPLFVQVRVKNFKLVKPENYYGPANPKQLGHIHYFLDNYPEVATDSTQVLFGKLEGEKYISIGPHSLAVELVHDNHTVLQPRIWKRVNFIFTH